MITNENFEIISSVLLYIVVHILWYLYQNVQMHDRRIKFLQNDPENDAICDDPDKKWVPKKKHEVLKAKYKCLKKLFQIYDAGVMGMIPPPQSEPEDTCLDKTHRKIRRSRRPKTDICTGTSELCLTDDNDLESYEFSVDRDYSNLEHIAEVKSSVSTQANDDLIEKPVQPTTISKLKDDVTQASQDILLDSINSNMLSENAQNSKSDDGKKKVSKFKFQTFIRRLFGVTNGRCHSSGFCAKRKRGPIRIKGQARSRNFNENSSKARSPAIMTCVQMVQKDCMADTTPRRCPIVGCQMTTNGIINYNDHLNLVHFPENKYICNYCHKGFVLEEEKIEHENKHIGISKLGKKVAVSKSVKSTSVTQTEPHANSIASRFSEDKLNKIINFIEKMPDLENSKIDTRDVSKKYSDNKYDSEDTSVNNSKRYNDRKVSSCGDIKHKNRSKHSSGDGLRWSLKPSRMQKSYASCCYQDEEYDSSRYRHGSKNNNSRSIITKTNNYPIQNDRSSTITSKKSPNIISYGGCINVQESSPTLTNGGSYVESCNEVSQESDDDTSTNIIYYTSKESVTSPPSTVNTVVKSNSKQGYNWEPSKKVIRV